MVRKRKGKIIMGETKKKHFNMGNVWGVVEKTKRVEQNGKDLLVLSIGCASGVTAFGRLWGEDQIDGLEQFLKEKPHIPVRFYGFFSTYLDQHKNRKLYNYSFYKWEPIAVNAARRATFILTGDITGISAPEKPEPCKISVRMVRPGKNGRSNKEDFELYVKNDHIDLMENAAVGQTWELKGKMERIGGEDEFGAPMGKVLPCILACREVK